MGYRMLDPYFSARGHGARITLVRLGNRGPSTWFTIFCLVFGVAVGFVTAAIAMSFWRVIAGEENRGLFILIWMFAAVVFFTWPMHIVARAQAMRRHREILRERVGDLDFEPSAFPMLATRAPGPREDLDLKAPDIERSKVRTFLARGRTAEQRMADYLMTLELKAETRKAGRPEISSFTDEVHEEK